MLHELNLDVNNMAISFIGKYITRCLQIDFHLASKYIVRLQPPVK